MVRVREGFFEIFVRLAFWGGEEGRGFCLRRVVSWEGFRVGIVSWLR